MFEKMKRKKEMQAKADRDAQMIYGIVNKILHHYPIGLSIHESISYYTLAVAYGNVLGFYPDDELGHLRNKLYWSNTNSGPAASRGIFGLQYDQIIENHFRTLRNDKSLNLFPIIKGIIIQNNEIFPEQRKSDSGKEVMELCNIYAEAYGRNTY